MPTSKPRPVRADAARNRRRLLDIAEAVLAEHGIAVSIDEVARRAGLGIGTLYRHFPTKEALFEAIVVDRIERATAHAHGLEAAADTGAAFFGFLEHLVAEGARKRDFVDALGGLSANLMARTEQTKQQFRRAVTALLARAQAAGAVRDDVTTGDVVALVRGVLAGADASPRERARHLAIVCDGLRHRSRPKPR